jgi:hypothetical protein
MDELDLTAFCSGMGAWKAVALATIATATAHVGPFMLCI